MSKTVPTLAMILSLLLLTACGKKEEQASGSENIVVQTAPAKSQMVTEVVELSGSVIPEPNRSVRVTSLIQGVLDYVGPHVGDWVQKNEIVARLKDSIQKAQVHQNVAAYDLAEANWQKARIGARPQEVEQARAALEVAKANALNADQNKARMQKLYEQEISAGRDYDLAVSQQRVAQSQEKAAEANLSMVLKGPRLEDKEAAKAQAEQAAGQLEQSKATFDLTKLQSPIRGVVAERYLDVGDQTGPATPVLLVVDPTIVNVQANLPVNYNNKLRHGQEVLIVLPDSKENLVGKIMQIGMKLDPVTNSVPVQIEVANADLRMKFGMVVKARIVIDKRQAIVVPKESIIGSADDPNKHVVNLITGGQSKITPVDVGITDGDAVEIKKGLKAGDNVATNINYELPDDTKVSQK